METPVRRVERADTPVMFIAARDESDEIGPAWDRLESIVGSLRGRRFFGVFDDSGVYRCCVQVRDGDDASALGLESAVIPGGSYLCATLRGPQPEAYSLLTPTHDELRRRGERDATRPSIESYRRHDRIDVLMPVLSGP
ncbi:GyrI-like domain-containing protein [Asanoa sp. WMMD1127]|uniref:GyrI-like domain-containing protein n=1 Tax=Asanoa sp. WMMD1127 TaxID=3016107 RepID=UPI00241770D5|nr:GyrI-like domain-containing protein [Asanoa sp. WMMD1127]MDG4824074.1 GyrI-like domain-containing protein [Asanoa sp. WMMD1127]